MSEVNERRDFTNEAFCFSPEMTIGQAVRHCPELRAWLPSLSPSYKKLSNPVAFKIMAGTATLEMIAQRGGFSTEGFLETLNKWTAQNNLQKAKENV